MAAKEKTGKGEKVKKPSRGVKVVQGKGGYGSLISRDCRERIGLKSLDPVRSTHTA